MTTPLRLRVHVSEPFDFERENARGADLFGVAMDSTGTNDEWKIDLDEAFTFNEVNYDAVLIAPRYVGEHLEQVHDALLGVPVRIAHRSSNGWHYAMTGMVSLAPKEQQTPPDAHEDDRNDI